MRPLTPVPWTRPLTETIPPHVTTAGNAVRVTPVGARGVVKLAVPVRRRPAALLATTRQ